MNDHRRIAWRLSARITGSLIAAFIAIDVFLAFLIFVARMGAALPFAPFFVDEKLAEMFK